MSADLSGSIHFMVLYRYEMMREWQWAPEGLYSRASRPSGHLKKRNHIKFATIDKTFVGFWEKASEIDIPFWV